MHCQSKTQKLPPRQRQHIHRHRHKPVDRGAVNKRSGLQSDNAEQHPRKDRPDRLRKRLVVVHHCEWDGLNQDAVSAKFPLQPEKHKAAKEKFPREHIDAIRKFIRDEKLPSTPSDFAQRISVLKGGKKLQSKYYARDHERTNTDNQPPTQLSLG